MHYQLRVLGGTIVSGQGQVIADIGIRDGRILTIGDLSDDSSDETLDARNLHVLPGVIDSQVHFREPGLDHKEDIESGTRSAVMGGVTTVFEMPNTNPLTTTAETLQDKLDRAKGRSWCNIAFFVGASTDNIDQLPDLEMLPGTPGIKIFMGSSTGTLLVENDEELRSVLRNGKRRCSIHAEDEPRLRAQKAKFTGDVRPHDHPSIRDVEAARLATERILRLSEETGRPVHVLHISTEEELPILLAAKQRGLGTTCEVTPQHLSLYAPDCYDRLGTLAQMNPPIRERRHQQALWVAVKHGLFDVFGSDHAPHTLEEKSQVYPKSPSGMPGVQTLVPVLLEWVHRGELALDRFVRMACENPALLFGMSTKGFIREGYDADLTIVDLNGKLVVDRNWIQTKSRWSPYEGHTLHGRPVHTVVRGHVAVKDGELQGEPMGSTPTFDWK